jgi:catechol 2,3-dioxygenase-like lactoylglutathione lyase family enzyme
VHPTLSRARPSRPWSRTHLHLDETGGVHVDRWVNDGDTVESEVERLVALGAKRVDWENSDDSTHLVLTDPDGNLFCVCA